MEVTTAAPRRAPARLQRPAIERLAARRPDAAAVDRFLTRQDVPIVEGSRCTFLWRGEADGVEVKHAVLGLPPSIPLQRIEGTDLWATTIELPPGSRVEYKLELRWGDHRELHDDPLNPRVAHNPMGTNSVVHSAGYEVPDWVHHDPEAREGSLLDVVLPSRALRRDAHTTLYLPARFRRTRRYPLLVVHDGSDYLQYASFKTVLDNLIHRLDVADVVVAFTDPGDRLEEYPSAAHARFVTTELVPHLEEDLPLVGAPAGRALLGSSFGGIACLSTASRSPDTYGAVVLQSASMVFTDIGFDHGGGEVFDPVVRLVNRYRARPKRFAERLFVSCGVYEPLIARNRAMVPVFESTGMTVRYVESRDGHNWESWRDRLRDALTWIFPGEQKLVYE